MNKKLFLVFFLVTALVTSLFIGCDDSGNSTTPPTTGSNPNIQLKAGSVYTYYNDSISTSGTFIRTQIMDHRQHRGTNHMAGQRLFPNQQRYQRFCYRYPASESNILCEL